MCRTVKQPGHFGRRNALSVVLHNEKRLIFFVLKRYGNAGECHTVQHSVFHQICQHLHHQCAIHGYDQHLVRQIYFHRNISIALGKLPNGAFDDLLRQFRRLLHLCVIGVDPRDGQQVFHHADQPLGLLVGALQQLPPLLRRQRFILLQQHIGGAHNACQRGADIVRHGTQQIGMYFLPLRLTQQRVTPLGPACHGSRDKRDGQHDNKCYRKSRQCKADLPIRRRENVVHTQHAENRHQHAEQIAVCQKRR